MMPGLSKSIPGCGYSDRGDSLGFHFEDLSVLLESLRITIVGAEDEVTARRVIEWLKNRAAS